MSYQVLARKWRPKTFSEVVGQEHILTALANGLKENRLHHAYLFSGTRGVGKTSIARLFAKGLNCINGITPEPCGKCAHCQAIEEGHFIDLIEIDAASRTKVEDTRELLDNVQYKPVQGRYKVYLIDEVHMLSRHSFNALLKTLEEPPEYVKFLLATTDPQKLPMTILSRCMQFHLKALEPNQISRHLAHILRAENIPFEHPALEKIAKAAEGSIRDSLSLTDQAIAMSNADITLSVVSSMLGLLDDNQPIDILYALQQGNGEALMKAVQSAAERGADWEQLLIAVGETLHQIAMYQLLPAHIHEESKIDFLAKHISPEEVQLFYQIVTSGRKELAFAPNRRMGTEMILLRALAFHPKFTAWQPKEEVASAVGYSTKLVDIPVFSTENNTSDKKDNEINTIPQKQVSPVDDVQSRSPALSALEQIQKLRSQSIQNHQKKNYSGTVESKVKTEPKVTALPVISPQQKSERNKTELLDRFVNLATQATQEDTSQTLLKHSDEIDDDESNELNKNETALAETYRWEWINPEMAGEENGERPSDIKRAILQEKTPEVVAKVIALAEQQDPWTYTVGRLNLENLKLIKQIALNSVLLQQTEEEIKLGLRSSQSHLNKESAVALLQQTLSDYYGKAMSLQIELNDEENLLTPLDQRRKIYQQLSEQARQDLLQDSKIELLQQAFDAKLDMQSIRPV